jgi:hypothetical protein
MYEQFEYFRDKFNPKEYGEGHCWFDTNHTSNICKTNPRPISPIQHGLLNIKKFNYEDPISLKPII